MSMLRKMEWENNDILITLKLTKKEYEAVKSDVKEFIILPAEGLYRTLTTGRLGNGNRIMVPTKFLKKHEVDVLRKKVQGNIIDTGERKFLVIELENKRVGIPVFIGD